MIKLSPVIIPCRKCHVQPGRKCKPKGRGPDVQLIGREYHAVREEDARAAGRVLERRLS